MITLGFSSNNAYISEREAERILSVSNEANEIMVRVDLSKHAIEEYADKIHTINPIVKIDTYKKRLASVGDLVDAFDVIAFIVVIISVIVSAATVFVMVYINALSKQKQIGILKAIGIKERIIEWSYVIQSIFYSCIGIAFGTLFLYAVTIPYLKAYPIAMPFGDAYLVLSVKDYVLSFFFMLFSSIAAGYIPARVVSKREILKVIWG